MNLWHDRCVVWLGGLSMYQERVAGAMREQGSNWAVKKCGW